jgi:AraC family transcriptional regulator of adaptative response/methylated-DNA-[protein]-cysteine methyltransferase
MSANDYARIEQAIRFIGENFRAQPGLAAVARHVGLSEFHFADGTEARAARQGWRGCGFQRLFRRWAGVSPKRFQQFLSAEYARELLRASHNVLDVAHATGLSGAGRLHDLSVNIHAATPGEIRRGGEGLILRHGRHPTPFGDCFVALTDRGVCALAFGSGGRALEDLQRDWPHATLRHAPRATQAIVERIFRGGGGRPPDLHLPGTNLQIRVWEALLRVPAGAVVSYRQLARAAGAPRAVRAVASAVARNPVAYLIPCQRVIRSTGAFGEYRWGETRKRAMLAWEAAHYAAPGASSIAARQRR